MNTQLINEVILDRVAEEMQPFEAIPMSHPAWMDDHPSGFGVVCAVEQGNAFFYNPERIASTISHLDHEGTVRYADAIVDWWIFSTYMLSMGLSASTIITTYALEHPEPFSWFANHPDIFEGRFTLKDWLAPTVREDP